MCEYSKQPCLVFLFYYKVLQYYLAHELQLIRRAHRRSCGTGIAVGTTASTSTWAMSIIDSMFQVELQLLGDCSFIFDKIPDP
ncbi:hypothetical protein GN244_ATG04266 [Phytophthora infestans]|uniref:Uncharacterized protein n=1 Tax=Phytophthora infestans TaxID=4787 RepID=A0A833SN59_PHYIN|nr:hypothetical protein GN244_ATG04266 [Phytophthora infestans]